MGPFRADPPRTLTNHRFPGWRGNQVATKLKPVRSGAEIAAMTDSEAHPPLMPPNEAARDALLRKHHYTPPTPQPGYQFGESPCSTPQCKAMVRYEIAEPPRWPHLLSEHVRCDRCGRLYQLTLTIPEMGGFQVAGRAIDEGPR